MTLSPLTFVDPSRFDIPAKYIYAKFLEKNYDSSFGKDLYLAHLKVWNDCKHGDGKDGVEEYINSFKETLSSIKEHGFDPAKSFIAVTEDHKLLNGGHRVAACLLYDKYPAYQIGGRGETDVNYEYFIGRNNFVPGGLSSEHCDAIALEYCKLKPNTYIITIFPSALGDFAQADKIIKENSKVFYKKAVYFFNNGPLNLMRQIYKGESWGGNIHNGFPGLREKAFLCFQSNNPAIVYAVTVEDEKDTKVIKEKVRDLFGISNHSIHINDSKEETIRLARAFFNKNSIHFMNNCRYANYNNFENYISYFKDHIKSNGYDLEDFAVTASSVLSRYGFREGRDLDYLQGAEDLVIGREEIHSHNDYGRGRYSTTYDDIIYNPQNHFYFDDVKYASLNIVRELKEKRGEAKDVADLGLIDGQVYLNYNAK